MKSHGAEQKERGHSCPHSKNLAAQPHMISGKSAVATQCFNGFQLENHPKQRDTPLTSSSIAREKRPSVAQRFAALEK
jgi:hypothetical protein